MKKIFRPKNPEHLKTIFENALQAESFAGVPAELYTPFGYVLKLPAKRTRPVLLLSACEMFGTDCQKAMNQAIAIELFHNFTLIHDDIMDHAPMRRGVPSVHEQFGSATAILCGDAMLVFSFRYLLKADKKLVPVIADIFNDCALRVCEGQQWDMILESTSHISPGEYLKMIELKTAWLIASALRIGAVIGGAGVMDASCLFNFGKELGIAFQIKDDWLDHFGDTSKVGKVKGGDIIRSKKTYMLVKALEVADEISGKRLMQLYSGKDLNDDNKVRSVLEIYHEHKIPESTQSAMAEHFEKAMDSLEKVSSKGVDKTHLRQFAETLMNRGR